MTLGPVTLTPESDGESDQFWNPNDDQFLSAALDDGEESMTREQNLQARLAANQAQRALLDEDAKSLRAEIRVCEKGPKAGKFAKHATRLHKSLLQSGKLFGFNRSLDAKTVQEISELLDVDVQEFKHAAAIVEAAQTAAEHAHAMLTRPVNNPNRFVNI